MKIMRLISDDNEAIFYINKLYNLEPSTEEEWSAILVMLEEYQVGLADVLTGSKKLIAPEEAIRIARENNKPILL